MVKKSKSYFQGVKIVLNCQKREVFVTGLNNFFVTIPLHKISYLISKQCQINSAAVRFLAKEQLVNETKSITLVASFKTRAKVIF